MSTYMYHFIPKYNDLFVILLCRLNFIFFVCSSAYNCLCLVTISYIIILISTLTVNYEFYLIVLVTPHNNHNNVASSDVFTCVLIKRISLSLSLLQKNHHLIESMAVATSLSFI